MYNFSLLINLRNDCSLVTINYSEEKRSNIIKYNVFKKKPQQKNLLRLK